MFSSLKIRVFYGIATMTCGRSFDILFDDFYQPWPHWFGIVMLLHLLLLS